MVMKSMKFVCIMMAASLLFAGCNMSNLGKGALIGGGSGAAVGAGIGALIGKGKGAAIGAAIGTVVGTTAGSLIGKKMDDAAAQAKEIEGANVEQVTDANGLKAVKVSFDSGILFAFNSAELNAQSRNSLSEFSRILMENPEMDVDIYGHTDKVGTYEANMKVSQQRAEAVASYLRQCGVNNSQLVKVQGVGYNQYDESLSAADNRRVDIYLYASEDMIKAAENGTLK